MILRVRLGGVELTRIKSYSARETWLSFVIAGNDSFLVWSRSAVSPQRYMKRKGLAGPASYMALMPAIVQVSETRLSSARSIVAAVPGLMPTVLHLGHFRQ